MESILPYFIPFFFVGFFCFVLLNLSRLGWHKFTHVYGTDKEISGEEISFSSGRIGLMNYNSVLKIKYNEDGLYLRPELIFRVFHKPLFIPWEEIYFLENYGILIISYAKVRIGKPGIGTISIKSNAYKKFEHYVKNK